MYPHLFLALLPVVLGCTNPLSNSCASFMSANPATAGPFCTSFTQNVITATTALPAWATNCSNKVKEISKECSCYYTGGPIEPPSSTQLPPSTIITSTTSKGNPPPTETGNCGSVNEQQLVGFGVGTTGGGTGSGTTVTSCSALTSAVKTGGVIRINGLLSGCGIIVVPSQTSILGVGSNSGESLS